jgi:molybdate transport system substrate-binding protein
MADMVNRRMLLAGLALAPTARAQAAPLRIIVTGAVEHATYDLAAGFTVRTGRAVEQEVGNAGSAAARLRAGEPFDVALNSAAQIDRLIGEGLLVEATRAEVGRSPLGLGIRAGLPSPAIDTPEALRATLLAAPSIAYSDSSKGATSGVHIDRMLAKLGIAETMQPRTQLFAQGVAAAEAVAAGTATLVMTQASEILAVPGAVLVGPLPESLNLITVYVGAVTRRSVDPAAAAALLRWFTGPEGATRFRAAGFRTL